MKKMKKMKMKKTKTNGIFEESKQDTYDPPLVHTVLSNKLDFVRFIIAGVGLFMIFVTFSKYQKNYSEKEKERKTKKKTK